MAEPLNLGQFAVEERLLAIGRVPHQEVGAQRRQLLLAQVKGGEAENVDGRGTEVHANIGRRCGEPQAELRANAQTVTEVLVVLGAEIQVADALNERRSGRERRRVEVGVGAESCGQLHIVGGAVGESEPAAEASVLVAQDDDILATEEFAVGREQEDARIDAIGHRHGEEAGAAIEGRRPFVAGC